MRKICIELILPFWKVSLLGHWSGDMSGKYTQVWNFIIWDHYKAVWYNDLISLALPLTSCMNLGKIFNLTKLWFPQPFLRKHEVVVRLKRESILTCYYYIVQHVEKIKRERKTGTLIPLLRILDCLLLALHILKRRWRQPVELSCSA